MGATLGQRLRALRKEQGLSQSDLAGDLVSPSYVSLIESGQRSPEREVLEGLAGKLGCSVSYLESGVAPEEITEQRLKLQFAEIALANGSAEEAHQQFAALAEVSNPEVRLAAQWGLARAYENLGNLRGAVTRVEALLSAARSGAPGAPELWNLLMVRCRLYRDAGDFARSIDVGEHALKELHELGLEGTEEEIKLASTLVGAYYTRGDLFSAQEMAGRVIERAERLGSPTARGSAYWNASVVAASRGQLAVALDLATKTLALLSESSDDQSLARMRTMYAKLLLRCDPPRFDEAEAQLGRAHEALAEMGLQPSLARCETEQARSAMLRGDVAEAVRMAERAVTRCASTDAAEFEHARVVWGLALVLSGQAELGADYVSSAAERLEDLESHIEAAQAHRDLAEALLQVGLADKAIQALRRAADCAGAPASWIRPGTAVAKAVV